MAVDDEIIEEMAQKIRNHPILHLEIYCESSMCDARAITLLLKDNDDLVEHLRAREWTCPICGEPAKLHGFTDMKGAEHMEEKEARISVNLQMRKRDHLRRTGEELTTFNVTELLDDRLPPTPVGWFDK